MPLWCKSQFMLSLNLQKQRTWRALYNKCGITRMGCQLFRKWTREQPGEVSRVLPELSSSRLDLTPINLCPQSHQGTMGFKGGMLHNWNSRRRIPYSIHEFYLQWRKKHFPYTLNIISGAVVKNSPVVGALMPSSFRSRGNLFFAFPTVELLSLQQLFTKKLFTNLAQYKRCQHCRNSEGMIRVVPSYVCGW